MGSFSSLLVKYVIGICLSVPVITTIANSDIEPSYFSTGNGIQKSCCKTESLKTILDTAYVLSSTLQELITTVKSKAEDVSDAICKSSDLVEQRYDCSNRSSAKESEIYSDCSVLQKSGKVKTSGIYKVWPKFYKEAFEIFCDMDTDGGGWSVFQRRGNYSTNPAVDFFRTWNEYKNGFGNLSEEFWLGNDKIFALTNSGSITLRIDMEDFEGNKRYAHFDTFVVNGEILNYKMNASGYSGDAGDSFLKHDGYIFATKDSANNKCPNLFKGGWWYGDCHLANLNGRYLKGKHDTYADGVNYESFKGYHYSLKFTEMKLRVKWFKDTQEGTFTLNVNKT